MSIGSLEREILGALLLDPSLFEKVSGLSEAFDSENARRVFGALKRNFETGTPLDLGILAHDLKESVPEAYLSGLLDGYPRSLATPEIVAEKIHRVRLAKEKCRLLQIIEREAKAGGGDFSLVEIDTALGKIRRLGEGVDTEMQTAATAEELAAMQIPEIDWLIEPVIERFGFCLVGAQKGVGKSLFVTQLALHAASGISPFLIEEIRIPRPLNTLLIQQEVSLPGMKDRLCKMRTEKAFNLEGRFRQKTTTGAWWNLTDRADYEKLICLIEKYRPDLIILDPLYTFYPKELNTSGDISPMMKILSDLKSNFGLGLVVVHHFSNKSDPDEVEFRSSVGRFMGHSMIANSADTTIGLDFLHPKYRQQTLPLPYQNYITVEITTRHGAWPARFCLERKRDVLLFEKSSIWQDLGRCLIPGQIEDVLDANDGQMLQKDVIEALAKDARRTTVRRAIDEALRSGKVTKEALPGKGHPVLLRLIK